LCLDIKAPGGKVKWFNRLPPVFPAVCLALEGAKKNYSAALL
jgi:hypothetical protein